MYKTFDRRLCHRVEEFLRGNNGGSELNIFIAACRRSKMQHCINAIKRRHKLVMDPKISTKYINRTAPYGHWRSGPNNRAYTMTALQ